MVNIPHMESDRWLLFIKVLKDLACKSDAKKPSYSYYLAVIERRRIASNFQIRSDMCGECEGSGSSPL